MKLFTAGVATESNTFAPMPTGLDDYTRLPGRAARGPADELHAALPRLAPARGRARVQRGGQPRRLRASGGAHRPARVGRLPRRDPRRPPARDAGRRRPPEPPRGDGRRRLRRLRGRHPRPGPRRSWGRAVPVGAELDPHCHVTPLMVEQATVLVLYKEFPHTDFAERAEDLFRLVVDAAQGRTRPHMALWDCRMIGSYFTTAPADEGLRGRREGARGEGRRPLHLPRARLSLRRRAGERHEDAGRSPTPGRPRARGSPGSSVSAGSRSAAGPIRRCSPWRRPSSRPAAWPGRPVVAADVADNPGGGFPGDSTVVLRALVELGVTDCAFATIWDPIAVTFARAAGPGRAAPDADRRQGRHPLGESARPGRHRRRRDRRPLPALRRRRQLARPGGARDGGRPRHHPRQPPEPGPEPRRLPRPRARSRWRQAPGRQVHQPLPRGVREDRRRDPLRRAARRLLERAVHADPAPEVAARSRRVRRSGGGPAWCRPAGRARTARPTERRGPVRRRRPAADAGAPRRGDASRRAAAPREGRAAGCRRGAPGASFPRV